MLQFVDLWNTLEPVGNNPYDFMGLFVMRSRCVFHTFPVCTYKGKYNYFYNHLKKFHIQ